MGKEQALRYNDGKLRYDLIHPKGLEGLVKVLTTGAIKYDARNWEKGMSWSKCIASLKRHLAAIESGEDVDKETSLLHIDHLQCNAHFLSTYYHTHLEMDDRDLWWKKPFKKVWFDLDGVICNKFEEHFLEYLSLPRHHPTDWNDYRFRRHFKKIIDDDKFWSAIPTDLNPSDISYPIEGYCTARPCSDDIIEQWLENNGFPAAEIINVGMKGNKAEALKDKCDVMIDDSIKNFVQLNSAGITCYLMTRPHNVKYDVGIMRINTIQEFIQRIKQ